MQDDNNDGDHQEDVNETASNWQCHKTEDPQNQQNGGNCKQHDHLPCKSIYAVSTFELQKCS